MKVVKTSHHINETVMDAVYEGLLAANMNAKMDYGHTQPTEIQDAVISYGILRGTLNWFRSCESFIYLDKSFLRSGHFDGYYRISRNGFQASFNPIGSDAGRLRHSITKDSSRVGSKFLILPPTEAFSNVLGITPHNFVNMVKEWLEYHKVSSHLIEVRIKNEVNNSFESAIEDAALVIAANSGAAIKAIVKGVSAVSMAPTTLWSFLSQQPFRSEIRGFDGSNPLECSPHDLINLCVNSDFQPLFDYLAYHEYTLDELRKGLPWMEYTLDGMHAKMSPIGFSRIPFAADGRIQRPRYMR